MTPFEVLYGWSYNNPINWSDPMNRVLIGLDMLEDMENGMKVIMNNLKVGQDRQKSYEDHHKEFSEFHIGRMCIYASSLRIAL